LAFAGQSIVVEGSTIGEAIRRSAGFPIREPLAFGAYVLVSLAVCGGLSVLGELFAALVVSQLTGIISPLVAIPFLDAFKTALYADRPFVPRSTQNQRQPTPTVTDGGSDRPNPVDTGAESDSLDRENASEHVKTDTDDDDVGDGPIDPAITQSQTPAAASHSRQLKRRPTVIRSWGRSRMGFERLASSPADSQRRFWQQQCCSWLLRLLDSGLPLSPPSTYPPKRESATSSGHSRSERS